jgi:two-component system CheB/CheR fusion protein
MEALQRSELRFRTLVEGMPQLIWRAADGGHWTWSSPQWSTYTGQGEDSALGLGWLDMLHPDDRDAAKAAWQRAAQGRALDMEVRVFHESEQRYRHFRKRALPLRDSQGALIEWLGTSTDVDDLLQLQSEQAVLVRELQHRTRNLMAIVRAITRRTIQSTATIDSFAERIDSRFSALARVQSLLSRREGATRVPFDILLREEISAHVELDSDGRGKQVTLEGPSSIALRSATVQTFALALHELATNATKYGALSQPGGHLHIKWIVEEAVGGKRLFVDWRESGVSDVPKDEAAAKGGGYGRELIERALPYQLGARTTFGFEPDGVHCTIEVLVPADDGAPGDN